MKNRVSNFALTNRAAVIAEWPVRILYLFFDGVKGDDRAFTLVDQKRAPNRHSGEVIILEGGALLKEAANVVSEGTGERNGAAGLCKGVEAVEFGWNFGVRFENWKIHCVSVISRLH